MNLYSNEEIERINKTRETNDRMEEFFNDKRLEWNKKIEPLFKVLSFNVNESIKPNTILDAQSLSLAYRQDIHEQINFFMNKRSKETAKLKKLKQDKFIFYATGFGIKTSMGEKAILINAHIAENDRSIELIETYIEFLRDTVKNLDTFGYSIKNMIDLLNYLGR